MILAQRREIEQFVEFRRRSEGSDRMMMMWDRRRWTDWFLGRALMLEFVRQGQPTVRNVGNSFEIILHRGEHRRRSCCFLIMDFVWLRRFPLSHCDVIQGLSARLGQAMGVVGEPYLKALPQSDLQKVAVGHRLRSASVVHRALERQRAQLPKREQLRWSRLARLAMNDHLIVTRVAEQGQ